MCYEKIKLIWIIENNQVCFIFCNSVSYEFRVIDWIIYIMFQFSSFHLSEILTNLVLEVVKIFTIKKLGKK